MIKVLDVPEKYVMTQNTEAKLSKLSIVWKVKLQNPFCIEKVVQLPSVDTVFIWMMRI